MWAVPLSSKVCYHTDHIKPQTREISSLNYCITLKVLWFLYCLYICQVLEWSEHLRYKTVSYRRASKLGTLHLCEICHLCHESWQRTVRKPGPDHLVSHPLCQQCWQVCPTAMGQRGWPGEHWMHHVFGLVPDCSMLSVDTSIWNNLFR